MTALISKIQYKRSEKGEFHDIAFRNLDETLALILSYPWDTERSLASVELSCPSITVEHPVGTYLKVGPYFSGKFSIYYFYKGAVYLKITDTLEGACESVRTYFTQNGKLGGFKRYGFTIRPSLHFRTNPFKYKVDRKAAILFFRFPLYMLPLFLLLIWLGYLDNPEKLVSSSIAFISLLLVMFSPLAYFYFNYRAAEEDKYLQISRGDDQFIYGTADNLKTYKKHNVAEINAFGLAHTRSPWRECEIFILTFDNGEEIKLTSLLISREALTRKFPDQRIITNKKFFPTYKSIENSCQSRI